jgi:hypothetical protein
MITSVPVPMLIGSYSDQVVIKKTTASAIVYMQELASRTPAAPDLDRVETIGALRHRSSRSTPAIHGWTASRNCRWDVDVCLHHQYKVTTVLPSVRLTQFQAGNRGNRIPLVSWLDGASEQAAFRQ